MSCLISLLNIFRCSIPGKDVEAPYIIRSVIHLKRSRVMITLMCFSFRVGFLAVNPITYKMYVVILYRSWLESLPGLWPLNALGSSRGTSMIFWIVRDQSPSMSRSRGTSLSFIISKASLLRFLPFYSRVWISRPSVWRRTLLHLILRCSNPGLFRRDIQFWFW